MVVNFMDHNVSFILFSCVFAYGISGILYQHSFIRYIEKNHPDAWRESGEFHFFKNNSFNSTMKFMKYIYLRKYLRSQNSLLISKCNNYLILSIAHYFSFFIFLIAFAYAIKK